MRHAGGSYVPVWGAFWPCSIAYIAEALSGVNLKLILAATLGGVHGCVGVGEQLLDGNAGAGENGDAKTA